jgi:hypothetical protein
MLAVSHIALIDASTAFPMNSIARAKDGRDARRRCAGTTRVFLACLAWLVAGEHGAPAPLIGAGIPALLGVGGVLLGRKLLKRK